LLSLTFFACNSPVLAQSQQSTTPSPALSSQPPVQAPSQQPSQPSPSSAQPALGNISGTVVDQMGNAVSGAHVALTRDNQSQPQSPPPQQALSGDDGQFSFNSIVPGPFHLTVTAPNFAPQTISGTLHPAEFQIVPRITLALATVVTQVRVEPQSEIAEAQVKEEEKQRALGFVPNFYVTYEPDAVPLSPKQKFELAWRTTVDPVTFGITAAVAGIEQADNTFSGYGQGAKGYGKRYGAAYADLVSGTFIGSAILPSLLKQDPRYFYKGTGTVRSRLLYAIANSVICKGDNKRWQPNYSSIGGSLASGAISNLYYPAQNRNGAALTFETALIGIGASAGANVLEEFVIRKLTPNLPSRNSAVQEN
jgi:Carboxypeptidase regulatory-like domain